MKNLFRPCIDLHQGQVKQIVGSTLFSSKGVKENFISDRPVSYFADFFKQRNLAGGHVVMLGKGNEQSCKKIIETWPEAFDVGGGLDFSSAKNWLKLGARKVIFTSYLFENGKLSHDRLKQLGDLFLPNQVVVDLSCKRGGDEEGRRGGDEGEHSHGIHRIMTKQWKDFSEEILDFDLISLVAKYCGEILVHAIDVEGKNSGIDKQLVKKMLELSRASSAKKHPIEMVYAGGISSYDDVEKILSLGEREIAFTVGSALDIYGGTLELDKIMEML